ncbi:MAG: hypothetical protein ACLTZY_05745 [Alistipes indistinctus]
MGVFSSQVNDMEINVENTYMNLFRFPNVSLQYGHLEGNTIYPATQTTTSHRNEMYLIPDRLLCTRPQVTK